MTMMIINNGYDNLKTDVTMIQKNICSMKKTGLYGNSSFKTYFWNE